MAMLNLDKRSYVNKFVTRKMKKKKPACMTKFTNCNTKNVLCKL